MGSPWPGRDLPREVGHAPEHRGGRPESCTAGPGRSQAWGGSTKSLRCTFCALTGARPALHPDSARPHPECEGLDVGGRALAGHVQGLRPLQHRPPKVVIVASAPGMVGEEMKRRSGHGQGRLDGGCTTRHRGSLGHSAGFPGASAQETLVAQRSLSPRLSEPPSLAR